MKHFILAAIVVFIFASCKKTYTCECKNSNATYVSGEIDNTKRQAKKSCEERSSGDTECYIK